MDFQIENVGPQLSEILAIVIPVHLVKVYNNYASTLIVYKVNRHISFLPNECICFEVELQKCLLIMSRRCFKKKTASHTTLSFLLCIDKCEMKNVQLLLLFFSRDSCLLSVYVLLWNKFSLQRRTFHCTFHFSNLCTFF